MTVARLNTSTAYAIRWRHHGFEGAVYRLGMALVAWAHGRTALTEREVHARRRREQVRHGAEAIHAADLARAAQTRPL